VTTPAPTTTATSPAGKPSTNGAGGTGP
jgi:hypothetical protein